MKERSIIVLIGAPASGKGTLADFISRNFNFLHISAGNLLRDEIESGSKVGKDISSIISSGGLVESNVINSLIAKKVTERSEAGILLDGYPRKVDQADFLDNLLKELKEPLAYVLNMDVNIDSIMKRVSNRVICENCKRPYNSDNKPDKCESCGYSSFVKRNDDTENTLLERINVYRNISAEVLSYYGDRVVNIDANGTPDDVSRMAEKVLINDFGLVKV